MSFSLFVSFECDSLSEGLEEKKEEGKDGREVLNFIFILS
jgi:hypothetical protein